MRKRVAPHREELIDLHHNQKMSLAQIAKHYKTSTMKIRSWLKDMDIKQLVNRPSGHTFIKNKLKYKVPPKEELLAYVNNGITNQQIEKIYGITNPVLKLWYKRLEIVRKPYEGTINEIPHDFVDWFNTYKPNKKEIYKKYNVSYPTVKRWIIECNLHFKGITTKIDIPIKESLEELNNQKLGTEGIAKHFDIAQTTARKWLYHYDLDIKNDNFAGISKGELQLTEFLNSLGYDFKSSKSILSNGYLQLDAFDQNLKIAFEYNGLYWHSIQTDKRHKKGHAIKFHQAREKNIKLYTIFENEWLYKRNIVESMIRSRCGILGNKIYARNCNIIKVSDNMAREFFDANHISGYSKSSLNYGLTYNDNLISVMSFAKPRFNKHFEWEIIRFASLLNHSIIGGAGKLFHYFIKENNPNNVLTYSDLRWGIGKVYENIGFTFEKFTPPNYYYFNMKDPSILYSRVKFQKHKLSKILDNFDRELSEMRNMENNKYRAIYDCGNAKYIWEKKKEA